MGVSDGAIDNEVCLDDGGAGYLTADWQWTNIVNRRSVTAFARHSCDEEFIAEVIMPSEFYGAFVTPGTYRTAGVPVQ